MSLLWLRYKTGATQVSRQFDAREHKRKPITEREGGTTLRKRRFSHLLANRYSHLVAIGADQLADDTAFGFLEEFWGGAQRWIAVSAAPTMPDDAEFVAVDGPEGEMPIEYIRNHKRLRSVSMTLIEQGGS